MKWINSVKEAAHDGFIVILVEVLFFTLLFFCCSCHTSRKTSDISQTSIHSIDIKDSYSFSSEVSKDDIKRFFNDSLLLDITVIRNYYDTAQNVKQRDSIRVNGHFFAEAVRQSPLKPKEQKLIRQGKLSKKIYLPKDKKRQIVQSKQNRFFRFRTNCYYC